MVLSMREEAMYRVDRSRVAAAGRKRSAFPGTRIKRGKKKGGVPGAYPPNASIASSEMSKFAQTFWTSSDSSSAFISFSMDSADFPSR